MHQSLGPLNEGAYDLGMQKFQQVKKMSRVQRSRGYYIHSYSQQDNVGLGPVLCEFIYNPSKLFELLMLNEDVSKQQILVFISLKDKLPSFQEPNNNLV